MEKEYVDWEEKKGQLLNQIRKSFIEVKDREQFKVEEVVLLVPEEKSYIQICLLNFLEKLVPLTRISFMWVASIDTNLQEVSREMGRKEVANLV